MTTKMKIQGRSNGVQTKKQLDSRQITLLKDVIQKTDDSEIQPICSVKSKNMIRSNKQMKIRKSKLNTNNCIYGKKIHSEARRFAKATRFLIHSRSGARTSLYLETSNQIQRLRSRDLKQRKIIKIQNFLKIK